MLLSLSQLTQVISCIETAYMQRDVHYVVVKPAGLAKIPVASRSNYLLEVITLSDALAVMDAQGSSNAAA